ncbi:CRISPR-associated helicase Cas3' [Paenibacillus campi]|uniref:CRISPR-associated helicase Cas3' n=1 Tax=Paenibacillus campi TaxID=3106031 RepID=UPI002AFF5E1C|nr:CRISPR-associated helicase Cas3' [Paenibacillus sp. SGZ-1009]
MDYIAHIRKHDKQIQTVDDHLREVKQLCEHYGAKIGVVHLAGLSGWLHDLGKNTIRFYDYIQAAVFDPEHAPSKGSVDHSTAGGKLLYDRYVQQQGISARSVAAEWIGNCIISHHQGLRNFVDGEQTSPYLDRVQWSKRDEQKRWQLQQDYEQACRVFWERESVDTFDHYVTQAANEFASVMEKIHHSLQVQHRPIVEALTTKYIFSCLIDADRHNSRLFEEGKPSAPTDELEIAQSFFQRAYDHLLAHLAKLEQTAKAGEPINRLRREMSRQCEQFAAKPSNVYTLSIPTGGGKTLASLRYGLRHALDHGKERIIYIVPYTTIIEQNAQEIRKLLPEADRDLILEHHSNVVDEIDPQHDDVDEQQQRIRLARDYWDRPIIFTTMVQFLNTFYAKGTRNTRRLHRLANAVLIFDEVQAVPIKCISLFNMALNFLQTIGRSSIVLCTATQPALDVVENPITLPPDSEIVSNLAEVNTSFKRVEIIDRTTVSGWDASEISDFVGECMEQANSCLIILNTKIAVRRLYDQLKQTYAEQGRQVALFHLSTNMCAAHRKEMLEKMKKKLEASRKHPQHSEQVICVSTQLIEAGVDISFECVIRSLAGLDSIAQAAGRCNRHGEDRLRQVYIIRAQDEVLSRLPEIRIGGEQTNRILDEIRRGVAQDVEILSPANLRMYFQYYYQQIKNDMDYTVNKLEQSLFTLMNSNADYVGAYVNKHGVKFPLYSKASFATVEQYFEVIDSKTYSIIAPYNENARELIADLMGERRRIDLGAVFRELQQYMVNVYDQAFKKLSDEGYIKPVFEGQVLILLENAYSDEYGIDLEGTADLSVLIG